MISSHDIEEWVEDSKQGQREFREAVHTILAAIAQTPDLRDKMVIKGGVLLAIRYKSVRFTRDIDFSTQHKLNDVPPEDVKETLEGALRQTVEQLDYDLDCRVQSISVQPRETASFPSIKITVGHAYKGTRKHKHLLAGSCPSVVSIDYSLNEATQYVEDLLIRDGDIIVAYALTDLISEKFRAVLQQIERNRQRRQDIFDLFHLLNSEGPFDADEKTRILHTLVLKCRARDIEPSSNALRDQEIYDRAKAEYPTLADEVPGVLPDFDEMYGQVREFYESLDWP
ncbi:MAG: nucleotidyl transferase AbiEii/AbiGii toxin family protein [Pseudomonadota bacterium]